MTHTICAEGQSRVFPHLERLWDALFSRDTDFGTKLERLFAAETAEFDLDYAFLSRIDLATESQHFETVHGSHRTLKPGETVPLAETYCRKTIADPEGTMVVCDAVDEGWEGDPAYETFGLGTYVGTTVSVEDGLYGTLCFANADPRDEPILDEEATLVEMYGEWAAHELNRWTGPPTHNESVDLDEHDVSPSQIDTMMSALTTPVRRSILLALVDSTCERSVDWLERTVDAENARVELRHVHLPKLETSGYIEWDRDSGIVSRGRQFSHVEPLVRLLAE